MQGPRWHILTLCKTLVSTCKQWPPFGTKICLDINFVCREANSFLKEKLKKIVRASRNRYRPWTNVQAYFKSQVEAINGPNYPSNIFWNMSSFENFGISLLKWFSLFWKLPIFSFSLGIFCHIRCLDQSFWEKIFDGL